MPSALLNLGTAGVSKAAFLFIAPFVERWGTGVFGTMPSSLFSVSRSNLPALVRRTCQRHHHPWQHFSALHMRPAYPHYGRVLYPVILALTFLVGLS